MATVATSSLNLPDRLSLRSLGFPLATWTVIASLRVSMKFNRSNIHESIFVNAEVLA